MIFTRRPDGAIVFHREANQTAGLVALCGTIVTEFGRPGLMVEVGSHAGESAEIFASYAEHVVCVDTWSEEHALAVDRSMPAHEVESSFGLRMRAAKGRITKLKMASPAAVKLFPDAFFDGVYIDGSHDFESVTADIRAWLPKVRLFVAGHDWVDGAPQVIRAVMAELGVPDWLFEDYSWMWRKR